MTERYANLYPYQTTHKAKEIDLKIDYYGADEYNDNYYEKVYDRYRIAIATSGKDSIVFYIRLLYNEKGYEEPDYGFRYDVIGSSFPTHVMPYLYNALIKGDDLFDFYNGSI